MDEHRHAWTVVGFHLAGERPMVRQSCACGVEREIRAWDRYWDGTTSAASPPAAPRASWRLVEATDASTRGRLMRPTAPLPSHPKGPGHLHEPIKIDIWSDVACPWCYIGKRNLEAGMEAYASVDGRPAIEVEYHSFELAPDTPVDFDGSEIDYLMRIKGISREQATQMLDRVAGIAAGVGLDYHFDAVRHTRTLKAHQLLHFAKARGLQREAKERLLRAYFVEGRHIGRDEDLGDLAAEVGLDRDEALASLASGEFADAVRADQQLALEYGIRGVPFFVIDRRYGLSGAQPPETFARALTMVAEERSASLAS